MLMALLGLLVVGGARVTHLAFLGNDPIFLRFCSLHRLPADRTVVAWLKAFTPPALEALCCVIRDLVYEQIEWLGLRRITLDLDGRSAAAGGTEATSLAREGDEAIVAASVAAEPQEAVSQNAAPEVRAKLLLDAAGRRPIAFPCSRQEGLELFPDDV